MKKGTVRTIAKYLNKSFWFRPTLVTLICVTAFSLSKDRTFSSHIIIAINLFFLICGLFLLFQLIQKKHNVECWIYCVLILAITMNKLYDPSVFSMRFHFSYIYGWVVIVIFGMIRIAGDYILRILKSTADIVGAAAEGWAMADDEKKRRHEIEKKQRDAERTRNNSVQASKKYANMFQEKTQKNEASTGIPETKDYAGRGILPELPPGDRIIFIVLLLVSLIIPVICGSIFLSNLSPYFEAYSSDTDFKTITALLNLSFSVFTMLIFLLIMWAVFLGILLEIWFCGRKLLSELNASLVKNEAETSFPIKLLIHTIAVIIICIYLSNNKMLTSDELNNLLTDGRLIVYPVAIAVVIPVYFVLVDWITNKSNWTGFMKSDRVKEIKKLLLEISVGSIMTLLNFIKFVTNDFLMSIQELAIEEEEKEGDEDETVGDDKK